MDARKIVVIVEDVEAARTALQWALQNLLRYGDFITLLHVFSPSDSRSKTMMRLLRLKGFQLALSFKDICNSFFNVNLVIINKNYILYPFCMFWLFLMWLILFSNWLNRLVMDGIIRDQLCCTDKYWDYCNRRRSRRWENCSYGERDWCLWACCWTPWSELSIQVSLVLNFQYFCV